MITTGISSHVRYFSEEKGVQLLSLSLLWSEDLYWNIYAMVRFFLPQYPAPNQLYFKTVYEVVCSYLNDLKTIFTTIWGIFYILYFTTKTKIALEAWIVFDICLNNIYNIFPGFPCIWNIFAIKTTF